MKIDSFELSVVALVVAAGGSAAAMTSAVAARRSANQSKVSARAADSMSAIESRRDYEQRRPTCRLELEAVGQVTPWHRLWFRLDRPHALDSVRVEILKAGATASFDRNDQHVADDGSHGTYAPVQADQTAPAWRVLLSGDVPADARVRVTMALGAETWEDLMAVDWPKDITNSVW